MVVATIGILAAVFIVNMGNVRERTSDAKLKNKLNQFKTALRMYYSDYKNYPDTGGVNNAKNITGTGSIYMSEYFSELIYYNVVDTGSTYDWVIACVELTNTTDKDIEKSQRDCFRGATDPGLDATKGYCVCIK